MPEPEILIDVVKRLEAAGIEYLLTGSHAAGLLGKPRTSHDIDLVVDVRPDGVQRLLVAFPSDEYYLDLATARRMLSLHRGFNIVIQSTQDKIDLWGIRDTEFDRQRFRNRVRISFLGHPLVIARAEDLILAKLRWAKEYGGSEKQLQDVKGIMEVQVGLDRPHLARWARELGVEEALARVEATLLADERVEEADR